MSRLKGAGVTFFRGLVSNEPELLIRGDNREVRATVALLNPHLDGMYQKVKIARDIGMERRGVRDTEMEGFVTRTTQLSRAEGSQIIGKGGEVMNKIREDTNAFLSVREESLEFIVVGIKENVDLVFSHPIRHLLRI